MLLPLLPGCDTQPQLPIDASELDNSHCIDGKPCRTLYRGEPFSGIRVDSEAPYYSVQQYQEGLVQGFSLYTNQGKLVRTAWNHQGKQHGVDTGYDLNTGHVHRKDTFVRGIRVKAERYDERGQLKSMQLWQGNRLIQENNYDNGLPTVSRFRVDGQKRSRSYNFYTNGMLGRMYEYDEEEGRLLTEKVWFSDGTLKSEERFYPASNMKFTKHYRSNGQLISFQQYYYPTPSATSIEPHGLHLSFCAENGSLKESTEYVEGKKQGLYQRFYCNGVRHSSYHYRDGVIADKEVRVYQPEGTLFIVKQYDVKGTLLNEIYYNPQGEVIE